MNFPSVFFSLSLFSFNPNKIERQIQCWVYTNGMFSWLTTRLITRWHSSMQHKVGWVRSLGRIFMSIHWMDHTITLIFRVQYLFSGYAYRPSFSLHWKANFLPSHQILSAVPKVKAVKHFYFYFHFLGKTNNLRNIVISSFRVFLFTPSAAVFFLFHIVWF